MRGLRYGVFAVVIVFAAGVARPVQAQPHGYGMMGGYGPGYMMGPGYGMMGGYGPGYMMGPGYTMGPGMMGYGGGYGPGYMMHGGNGPGPGMMGYGPGYYQGDLNLSVDQVKDYLERTIRNPNLTLGDVKQKDADTIVAEIVTKQGKSLVQRIDINRHNGFMQPEQ